MGAFAKTILDDNTLITDEANIGGKAEKSGLFKTTATNNGSPSYFFRGNVTNNYVKFANQTWRIVRINDDYTVRLVMETGINSNATYKFNPTQNNYTYMYFSNSDVTNGTKKILDDWYNTNIASNTAYASRVASGNYFCEQAKLKYADANTSGNASMYLYNYINIPSDYLTYKCSTDGNGKGLVNSNVGLLTVEEAIHAGGVPGTSIAKTSFYLNNGANSRLMSGAGFNSSAKTWIITSGGNTTQGNVASAYPIRPVINIKADTEVVGTGTKTDPYLIQRSTLKEAILTDNTIITSKPTLTTSINNTSDASGLYKSTDTNSGNPTYYFRGNVENNYVKFANLNWRVVRVNEDGSVRLVLQTGINSNKTYKFSPTQNNYSYMYFTNTNVTNGAQHSLNDWFDTAITTNAAYASKVATDNYYCEQAKLKYTAAATSGNASMYLYSATDIPSSYLTFKCSTDGNGKGLVNSNVGLLTIEEAIYAGGYPGKAAAKTVYYLNNGATTATQLMSGAGYDTYTKRWTMGTNGSLQVNNAGLAYTLRPVINLSPYVLASGAGTEKDPYTIVGKIVNSTYPAVEGDTYTYAAKKGESCSSCTITSVSNYGTCLTASGGQSTDTNYHVGTCANGKTKTNSVCGYGVTVGETYSYDCKTTYSCYKGGTLSGTTCTAKRYTCPNGGILNGTTCEK